MALPALRVFDLARDLGLRRMFQQGRQSDQGPPELDFQLQLPEVAFNLGGDEFNIRMRGDRDIRDFLVDLHVVNAIWRRFGQELCEARMAPNNPDRLSLAQGFVGGGELLEAVAREPQDDEPHWEFPMGSERRSSMPMPFGRHTLVAMPNGVDYGVPPHTLEDFSRRPPIHTGYGLDDGDLQRLLFFEPEALLEIQPFRVKMEAKLVDCSLPDTPISPIVNEDDACNYDLSALMNDCVYDCVAQGIVISEDLTDAVEVYAGGAIPVDLTVPYHADPQPQLSDVAAIYAFPADEDSQRKEHEFEEFVQDDHVHVYPRYTFTPLSPAASVQSSADVPLIVD